MTLADIIRGGLYAIDTPGALTRAGVANLADFVRGEDRFQGWRASGRDVLESMGMDRNQPGLDAGDVAGVGVEMALDPLNWGGLGWAINTAKAARAAKATNALRAQRLATGGMPEEVAKLTKAVDAGGNPLRTYHGTRVPFDRYTAARLSPDSLYGKGIYTTADPEIASTYATTKTGLQVSDADVLNYYRPGKVLPSKYVNVPDDEVLEVYTTPDGAFDRVKVRAVSRPGTPDYLRERPRFHSTRPDVDDLLPPAPNVRMQYVDSRSPWNMDESLGDDADYFRSILKARRPEGSLGQLFDYEMKTVGQNASKESFWKLLNKYDRDPNEILRLLGYDSIRHTGGQITGGAPHDVWVAFDPSQIYSPWIAPAERAVPRISPLASALAAYNAQKAYPRQ